MTALPPATTPPAADAPLLLRARGLAKRFPGVWALRGVDLDVRRGEVLAVLGENGAGKSTLMKILAGIEQPDAGEVWIDGQRVAIEDSRRALELGVVLIHQELDLADNLDVAGNLFLGREPHRFGWVDRAALRRRAREALARIGADFGPDVRVSSLAIGQQQLVEIAKALSVDARLLIMDEPSSSLSQRETERLFGVVRDLAARGVSVVYISHRLAEIEQLADRVAVLKDGRNSGVLHRGEIERAAMVRLMVGRELEVRAPTARSAADEVALAVRALRVPGRPRQRLDFSVRAGEIVGLAGLVGAGRSELLECLFGVEPALDGEIEVRGKALRVGGPAAALAAGIALVPEDRKAQALFLEMAVADNIGVASWARSRRFGMVAAAQHRRTAAALIEELSIDTPAPEHPVGLLSGGNQQKVVLARWLALRPDVLLLDEPTRGIDVGARHEIYALVERLAADGVAVVFASGEMEEVLRLAHRVLVMHEGGLAGELSGGAVTEEAIMQLATGGRS